MEIIITEWALNSYLNMRGERNFSEREYWNLIRPDILILKEYPDHHKFKHEKFWSMATDISGKVIANGYKMKWHQMGNGCVQIRLPIGILNQQSFLCEAYVKHNEKYEKRQMARFKTCLQLIRLGRFEIRGYIYENETISQH